MNAELWFDGGCEPTNPGGWMTSAFILRIPGMKDIRGVDTAEPDAANTNNVAEWNALLAGIKAFRASGISLALTIRGDSQLVVNQLSGKWACNKAHLKALLDLARINLGGIDWTVEWVPRDENAEADALGREAYEAATGRQIPKRMRA